MRIAFATLSLAVVGFTCLTGCITHEETVYREPERIKVEFENDTAARIFYEAFHTHAASRPPAETKTEVELPIVFEHKRRVVAGPAAAFNHAIRACDTNQDGRITEAEARIYADQQGR